MAVEPSFFVRFGLFKKGWTCFEFQVHKGSNCTFYLGANGEEQQNFTNICLGFEKKQLQSHHGSYSEKDCENDQVLFKTVTTIMIFNGWILGNP